METPCPRPEAIDAYAQGRLTDAEKARFEAHLSECSRCIGTLSVLLGLRDVPDPQQDELPEISPAVSRRLEQLVPGRRATRRRAPVRSAPLWKPMLAAAAVLIGIAILVLQFRPAPPKPAETPQAAHRDEPPPAPARRENPPPQTPRRAEEPAIRPEPAPLPAPAPPKPQETPAPPPGEPVKPKEERRGTVVAGAAATLERVQGQVRIVSAGSRAPAKAAQPILDGQSIETVGAGSWAVFRFPDATRVEVWGDTTVAEISEGRDDRGKRLRLAAGLMTADVSKQPEGRPLLISTPTGGARVVGTRLKLGADETRTYLEVHLGAVQLARTGSDPIEVAAGQYALAAPGAELAARPLPQLRWPAKLGVDQPKVDAAIDKGVEWLLNGLPLPLLPNPHGEFAWDELVFYTLFHAGLDRRHPAFQDLLRRILDGKLERTYNVALQAMVLSELDPVKYQSRIAQCGQFLIDNQCDNGQWDYGKTSSLADQVPSVGKKAVATPSGPRDFDPAPPARTKPRTRIALRRGRTHTASGDNSNSQYAALGLRACLEAEVFPPTETLQAGLKGWEKGQDAGGGWAYNGYSGNTNDRVPYGSMTAGGLSSVLIYRHYLKLPAKGDPQVAKAQKWIADGFSISENPKMSSLPADFMGPVFHYWLYALERSGMLAGADKFGAHDWYLEGAARLLETQAKEGSWVDVGPGGRAVGDTCFAILFLRRATAPLVASVDRKK